MNHTDARLEGVFHFPLRRTPRSPASACGSASELVEADVVEKQRAREITRPSSASDRDPGLLEWAGGNIFKARVFPIEAHAEKRVKIIHASPAASRHAYRYSYALQSELLRQHPLRELAIDVKLNSAAPLRRVASPTHPVRIQQAAHSARVEFAARIRHAGFRGRRRTRRSPVRTWRSSPIVAATTAISWSLLTPPEFEKATGRGDRSQSC